MKLLNLYRSIDSEKKSDALYEYKSTMRPPGNVPYVVDNLWEWKRPEEYPNRRFSVFASPSQELANKSTSTEGYKAFRVELNGDFKLAQLKENYCDSKYHPETKILKRNLIALVSEISGERWIDLDLKKKQEIGQLWIPCLRKKEISYLFDSIPLLKKIREQLYNKINYWNDVKTLSTDNDFPMNETGELFFEPFDGYRLLTPL
ncbi:MAG: hypothetical protein ACE5EK_02005 [Nitrospinales bacterium]